MNNHLYSNIQIRSPILESVHFGGNAITSDDNITEYGAVGTDFTLPNTSLPNFIKDGKIVLPHFDTTPVYMDKVQHGEEMAFPYLFPNGRNGLNEPRDSKLTYKQYFQHRIYNMDSRWRTNISYFLNAVNLCEREQLLQTVNVAMKWRKPETQCRQNQPNVHIRNCDIDSEDNPDVIQNSYMFAKQIRGTAAFWKNKLMNLLAMIKCLGPPTIFVTLSANDNHWPELAMMYTGLPFDEVQNANLQDNIKQDPLLAAIHFERRWNALLKYLKDAQPLGEIVDFFSRIEFQSRGSVHMHSFLWIKNAPDLNCDDHATIVEFIDSIISTELPSKIEDEELYNLVSSLQVHHHSFTCQRRRTTRCRFGFPYQSAKETKNFTKC